MSLRSNTDPYKSKNRLAKDRGFTKVKQENIDSIKAKRRRDISKYEEEFNTSANESKGVNAKLASQAAMAVIFAKSQEKPQPRKASIVKPTRKPPSAAEHRPININQSARNKVDNIYRKQTLSPDIVYKQKHQFVSANDKKVSPRLQDSAAKTSLYKNSNKRVDSPGLPLPKVIKASSNLPKKSLTDSSYEKFVGKQVKSADLIDKKSAPIMSTLAANKALVEYTSYEKQQNLITQDMLRKREREEAEQEKNKNIEAADNYLRHNGNVDTSDPNLQRELKKANSINKVTNDLVSGILCSYEFGSQHQEFDKLININTSENEEERSISEESKITIDEENDKIYKPNHVDSTVSFATSSKSRIPPPPVSPTFLSQHYQQPSQRSVSELIISPSKQSLMNTPDSAKRNKVQFMSDPLDIKNTTGKRSSSVSGESGTADKNSKTRGHRSNTISTLFHNIITSSNNSSPLTSPSQENVHYKKAVSFSPNVTAESLPDTDTNNGSTNLFKRTMRSLSLSKRQSDASRNVEVSDASPEVVPDETETREKQNVPKIEYSVLHNNLLPSYYKNDDGALNTSLDGSKGNVQFRTTLRDDMKKSSDTGNPDSKHRRLMSKLKIGHSSDKNSPSKSKRKSGDVNRSSSHSNRKGYTDTKRGDNLSSRFSDSDYSDSDNDDYSSNVMIADLDSSHQSLNSGNAHRKSTDIKRLSSTSFNSDLYDYDDDLLKYNQAKKDEYKIRHNISGGGKKSDIFIKIPAKLAYQSVKKRADNWEFRKNHTLKGVLKHEDSVASINVSKPNDTGTELLISDVADSVISGTMNPSSTMIISDGKAADELSIVKSPEIFPPKNTLNESSYIIGVHTKSKSKKKFDENKPWKSHIDVGYITSEEKKRYEAIWVSNKNRYLEMLPWYDVNKKKMTALASGDQSLSVSTSTNVDEDAIDELTEEDYAVYEEDLMVNFVVYEIYNRSNLPPKVLKRIYDLVDKRHDGTLNKQSFIVGMWLIDQCLYGKKLPTEIPDIVWTSVDKMIIGVDISHKSLLRNKKKIARQEIKELKKHERVVKENNKKEQQQV